MPYFLIRCFRATETNIFLNGATEQIRLLCNKSDMFTQLMTVDLSDIHAINQNTSAGHVIKSRDQLDQCALSGTGTSDNSRCLSGPGRKRNIFQNRFFPIRITEINMFKYNFFYRFSIIMYTLRADSLICDIRRHIHHCLYTFGRNIRTGIHHEHKAEQHH